MNISDIKSQYQQLCRKCRQNFNITDLVKIDNAFQRLNALYKDLTRENGEPMQVQPLAVATIVVETMGLGVSSVLSAMLFETVKEKLLTLQIIENEYGTSVSRIIGGLLELDKIDTRKISMQFAELKELSKDAELRRKATLHSENFRKLLITIAEDVRAILLRLAFRLHLMRTLDHHSEENRKEISSETLHSHAPIAHLLGLYHIKAEMEELSMRFGNPDKYLYITNKINESKEQQTKFLREFIAPIKETLIENGLDCEVKGRTKTIYSIWKKMQKQKVDVDEVFDILAIRIILKNSENEKADCWHIYSIITDWYKPDIRRLRDWISNPKPSGYESLHTTVQLPDSRWVEVQIRSERMDEIAEKGLAAHWRYKEVGSGNTQGDWLTKIREVIEKPTPDAFDTLSDKQFKELQRQIFVFTPKNELIALRTGACVLDFAFTIHSDIGIRCSGGEVNGVKVPYNYVLKNGDRVKVHTSKTQKPNKEWLNIVKSRRAQSKIKQFLNVLPFESANMGREIIQRKLTQLRLEFNDENIMKLVKYFGCSKPLELYQGFGTEKFEIQKIKKAFEEIEKAESVAKPKTEEVYVQKPTELQTGRTILKIDKFSKSIDYTLAKCCEPVVGDKIFGFVTVSKGTKIHRVDCTNAQDLKRNFPYRIIDAEWGTVEEKFPKLIQFYIEGKDNDLIAIKFSNLIKREMNLRLKSFRYETRKQGKFLATLSIFIEKHDQVSLIIKRIKEMEDVTEVRKKG